MFHVDEIFGVLKLSDNKYRRIPVSKEADVVQRFHVFAV
jgi:hypothetical protein